VATLRSTESTLLDCLDDLGYNLFCHGPLELSEALRIDFGQTLNKVENSLFSSMGFVILTVIGNPR
jgi:hypothetical protein